MPTPLLDKLGPQPRKTPYQRGVEDANAGRPAPAYPTPDSDWATRLYFRGYQSV